VALHYKPTEKWMMRLSSSLDYLNQGGYAYSVYKPEIDSLGDVSYNRPSGYKRLISGTGFTANYTSDKWSLNSQTSFQYIRDDQEVDQDFTANDTYFVTNGIRHNVISEEVTLKSEHENRFQWVVGTFLFSQWGTQDQGTDYLTKGYEQRSLYDTSLRGAALFAQGSYNLVGGLSATIGLRLDHEYNSMDYARTQLNHEDNSTQPAGEPFVETLKFTELIPRFGLQYAFSKRNMVFGNITKGYKGGGFNATIPTDEDRTYDSEYNWNYEIGAKLSNASRTLFGEMTLFYIDWKNQHITQTVPGVGNVIKNAGHSNSKGVEFSFTYRPITDFTIQANYGYTYAEFLDYKKSETADYSGNIVPMVPRNTFALNANYLLHNAGTFDAITFSAGINGVGKLYWLEDNAVCQHLYVLPSARVELRKGKLGLAFWGKNLSNTKYHSYYFVSSAKYAQKGTPLTLGVDLTFAINK
jgi:outer membrane receptor protein involved in Fe transport